MTHSEFKKLLNKYYDGQASAAEEYIINSWYDSYTDSEKPVSTDEADIFHQDVGSKILRNIVPAIQRKPWYRKYWVQIAAAVLVFGTLTLFVYKQQTISIQDPIFSQTLSADTVLTGKKQIKKVEFTDGSFVWLNAESRLLVMPGYGNTSRRLHLHGEGFFEVTPNSVLPFEVFTDDIEVKVLGTSFNIKAYSTLENIRVSVHTGVVEILDSARRTLSTVVAGQEGQYHKASTQYTTLSFPYKNSAGWRLGKTDLQEACFAELQQAFQNVYGNSLITSNQKIQSYKYTLTLNSNQEKKEAIKMICTMLETTYKEDTNGSIVLL